ncbi:MAG: hypothetical protein ACI4EG_12960 [Fusicatenibacter sp.]
MKEVNKMARSPMECENKRLNRRLPCDYWSRLKNAKFLPITPYEKKRMELFYAPKHKELRRKLEKCKKEWDKSIQILEPHEIILNISKNNTETMVKEIYSRIINNETKKEDL